jgi:hypothetical protein
LSAAGGENKRVHLTACGNMQYAIGYTPSRSREHAQAAFGSKSEMSNSQAAKICPFGSAYSVKTVNSA